MQDHQLTQSTGRGTRKLERWLLLLFLLSLPLLNPWIRGDGVGYYAYVRALLIEHSLDFQNDWRAANTSFTMGRVRAGGTIDAALPKMEQQFATMDRAVAKTGHLVGDTFTLADINFIPILFYMGTRPESSALLQRMPTLKHYLDRHMARKSVQETVPTWIPGQKASERAA